MLRADRRKDKVRHEVAQALGRGFSVTKYVYPARTLLQVFLVLQTTFLYATWRHLQICHPESARLRLAVAE
jgi:hypothetical protein